MKKTAVIIAGTLALVALTGCSELNGTFEEAVQARDACHEANGSFSMWRDGWGVGYIWECDLGDEED